ncbi:DNA-processing protein DprA [Alkalicoccus daliensis]|uniref:DNA processing protein n=1 Tax=Alkalicoccus daliensis TaxID=745820 RepID=A0A1H0A3P7_9BACI|nr:DNA-processing protein DprA [Alkalicoccus daliensis]SDN27593.1 DNA processing protein [Alkalicoccus daliensis]
MENLLRKRLLVLHYYSKGNSRLIEKLLSYDPNLTAWFEEPVDKLASFFPGNYQSIYQLLQKVRKQTAEEVIKIIKKSGGSILTKVDENYPLQLKHLHTPPSVIYMKGNISLLKENNLLGVVGARVPTSKINTELEELIAPLVSKNIVIVSGMAAGVDAAAHKTAIAAGGKTIAVLAFGTDQLYPSSNRLLKQELEEKQLLISEYPPYVKPQKWHFPERNRLISGLSKGVLVVEAKKRSGSLITAETALEQGKDVYAVPGRISDPLSEGTNRLIQDGAKLILSAEDLLEEFREVSNF